MQPDSSTGLPASQWADTASYAAKTLRAALMSRSCAPPPRRSMGSYAKRAPERAPKSLDQTEHCVEADRLGALDIHRSQTITMPNSCNTLIHYRASLGAPFLPALSDEDFRSNG